MAPHEGLVHLKEYDIKDSNVELIGTDLDHKVKYTSAATEPAWNDGAVGLTPGLRIWRIERFEVVPWPQDKYGWFYDGDSYIVLYSYKVSKKNEEEDSEEDEEAKKKKIGHDVFFWLGAHTSQDEAGTAAYKTVELDEFLGGRATQHRELQASPSEEFMALFPRLSIRRGGVESGFRKVEEGADEKEEGPTLLRVFKHPGAAAGRDTVVVVEVEPTWESLDEGDVFVLDAGSAENGKIYVWQGKGCSPMEKAKAAQVVHDMTTAKHVEVEVLAQAEFRSSMVVKLLGGGGDDQPTDGFKSARPVATTAPSAEEGGRGRKLWRLSDESGTLRFELIKDGQTISQADLKGDDVFVLDDAGREIWVWVGSGASTAEKAAWLKVTQAYVRRLQEDDAVQDAYLIPVAKVHEGSESPAFLRSIRVS